MGSKSSTRGIVIFLLLLVIATPPLVGKPRKSGVQQGTAAKQQATAVAAYPESAEGLKSLLQDWFAAIKAGDTAKASQYLESFAIPNHQEWFAKTFGATEGGRLETKYTELQAKPLEWLERTAEREVKAEKCSVELAVFDKSNSTQMRLPQAFLAAMIQPTPLYHAVSRKDADDKSPYFLGNFVYVDGGFRYIDLQVMQALGAAPPMRVMIGGSVQGAKLTHRVEPVYPQDAKIKGTVVLHVIIATDGTMKEIQVVSGHPLLFQAALDAVKQWRYKPTLLNGEPVEVDSQIEIEFSPPN